MKYLILNNNTPVHTELANKISTILDKNGIQNTVYSPFFKTNSIGSLSFYKFFLIKSLFKSLLLFFKGYNNIVLTSPTTYVIPVLFLSRVFKKKSFYFMHEPNLKRKDFYSLLVNLFNKIIGNICTDIVVLSKFAEKEANSKFILKRISRINYPSGSLQKLPPQDKKYITFVGNLSNNKRLDLFINLAQTCSEEFIIAGSGDFSQHKNNINKANINLINKFLTKQEFDLLIQQSKFIILPYETSTQSAVLFDSFRNKTPVIATNCGSFSEFVLQGFNGYLFDIKDFVNDCLSIIENTNKSQIKLLSQNCAEYFKANLSDDLFEEKIMNLIKN